MNVGVPQETYPGEHRVAIVPAVLPALKKGGMDVVIESRAGEQALRESVSLGMSPQQVADCVFTAIREGKFYIITDSEQWKPWVQRRMEDILQERNPTNPFQS